MNGAATPQGDPADTRRTVYFSGRVQGVFFRATARDVAAPFHVTGFVRNLPDGRVELVAEGARSQVDRFIEALTVAMRSNITDISSTDSPATGEFDSFSIAY